MVFTTASHPALVGKVVLHSFVGSAKVELSADLLACVVAGSLWVPAGVMLVEVVASAGVVWAWLLLSMKGLVCATPHQDVLLQRSVCSLSLATACCMEESVVLEGCCLQVHCEELADDVLVYHQLESSLWCCLDAGGRKYVPGLHLGAKVQDLRLVLPFLPPGQPAHRLAGEGICQKGYTYPFLSYGFPACQGRDA